MRAYLTLASAIALGIAGCADTGGEAAENGNAATVAEDDSALPADLLTAPGRPEEAIAQDADRHPEEVLAFFGIEPGDTVVDVYAGSGYYTELLARLVGPGGTVYPTMPEQMAEEGKAPIRAIAERNANVEPQFGDIRVFDFPDDSIDFAMLSNVYHDVYWSSEEFNLPEMDPAVYLADLYNVVAPGGGVGVIDHVANPGGDTRAVVEELHRIDPAVIRADFEAAGFEFAGELDALRNPEDDHTINVFDDAIRGQTDKIVYLFRKPAE